MSDTIKNGAVAALIVGGGALVAGPTLGGPVAGFAADQVLDSDAPTTEAGMAVGVASLIAEGASNPYGAANAERARGYK